MTTLLNNTTIQQSVGIEPGVIENLFCTNDNDIVFRLHGGRKCLEIQLKDFEKIYLDYCLYIRLLAELLNKIYLSHDKRLSWNSTVRRTASDAYYWDEAFTRKILRPGICTFFYNYALHIPQYFIMIFYFSLEFNNINY